MGVILPPLRDVIRPPVRVLLVGINPGVRSSQLGHHFAGPSNRFWKLLYESRLVPEPIRSEADDRLPEWGFGITNLVARATPPPAPSSPRSWPTLTNWACPPLRAIPKRCRWRSLSWTPWLAACPA
jgi:TDG/mug DNA glycosylase family protein